MTLDVSEHGETVVMSLGLQVLTDSEAALAVSIVEAYPWKGLCLDWSRLVPHQKWEMSQDNLEDIVNEIERMTPFLVLIMTRKYVVLGGVGSMLEHLDELLWKLPGRKYMVGARLERDQIELSRDVVLEYDGGDWLRAFPANSGESS